MGDMEGLLGLDVAPRPIVPKWCDADRHGVTLHYHYAGRMGWVPELTPAAVIRAKTPGAPAESPGPPLMLSV